MLSQRIGSRLRYCEMCACVSPSFCISWHATCKAFENGKVIIIFCANGFAEQPVTPKWRRDVAVPGKINAWLELKVYLIISGQ